MSVICYQKFFQFETLKNQYKSIFPHLPGGTVIFNYFMAEYIDRAERAAEEDQKADSK